MFRHALVLVVAVAVALGLAQQMMKMTSAHAAPPVVAQAAPELIPYAAPPGEAGQAVQAVQASTAPAIDTPPSPQGAELAKGPDGHYWADAEVNGRPVHFLVDTGASFVALTRDDAEKLGLDPGSLAYDAPVTTANGKTRAARVQLDYVAVSGARVEQVPAMVIEDGLSTSLLGMSYLGRLSRFEATPTRLVLHP